MQGQEVSEQGTNSKSSVGIDVSQLVLEAHVHPGGERLQVANTAQGIRQLKRWLGRFDIAVVVFEATGKWHRPLWRSLIASGIPAAMTDPFRVRMFAKAQGILAKTDRLDAAVLSAFAARMSPPLRPPPPEALENLAELAGARDSAVAEETALKNQLHAANDPFLRRQLVRRIGGLDKIIAELESEIAKRIAAEPSLARRYEILTSIPSVGFASAAGLIARLAELGSLNAKQITMLAGLAPVADQSGKREGVRVIWGGRTSVRRMLYLAAISAVRCNPDIKVFYKRLRAKGKAAKPALIASARKLLLLANTLLAENRTWMPQRPIHA